MQGSFRCAIRASVAHERRHKALEVRKRATVRSVGLVHHATQPAESRPLKRLLPVNGRESFIEASLK
ncbi:hypothetical protein ABEV74_09995 [Paenibacillus cisolokensis]|uniref:hypothetical protein n=1 Tax=Paenibacillus cisolokensis TaxID=1658519 RepID=UPI003D2C5342